MDKLNIINSLTDLCGEENIISDSDNLTNYNQDWDNKFFNKAICATLPKNSSQVSRIVNFCNLNKIKIVPQGGNTGLVGGSTPSYIDQEVIVNLKKMDNIYEIDDLNYSIDLGAGVILQNAKDIALKKNLLLPLDIASSGSSQIGGNIATNAGGINVIKYGSMRDQILGLEIVIPNGEIVNINSKMKKNNTGYDLKNLMCGSEGTLGIITRATLKLYPRPENYYSFFLSFDSVSLVLSLYKLLKNQFYDSMESCEFLTEECFKLSIKHKLIEKHFFTKKKNYYLLLRFSSNFKNDQLRDLLVTNISELNNLYTDVIIPQNLSQENKFWKFRESITEAQKREGCVIHNDISLPIDKIEEFINEVTNEIMSVEKNLIIYPFGHLGDTNIHFNIIHYHKNNDIEAFESIILDIINSKVHKLGGSISAEHGIGIIKKNMLHKYETTESINMMKSIKRSIDPKNILNHGKVFDL